MNINAFLVLSGYFSSISLILAWVSSGRFFNSPFAAILFAVVQFILGFLGLMILAELYGKKRGR